MTEEHTDTQDYQQVVVPHSPYGQSAEINKLAEALSKFQGKIKNPPFDSVNEHYGQKYASLAVTLDTVRPVLSEFGLSIIQLTIDDDVKYGCVTRLQHNSGQYIETTLLLKPDRTNPHGAGSALTYAKKYSLLGILGVAGDEEDDGNSASNIPPPKQDNDGSRKVAAKPKSETKLQKLTGLLKTKTNGWSGCKPEHRPDSYRALKVRLKYDPDKPLTIAQTEVCIEFVDRMVKNNREFAAEVGP